MRAFEMRVVQTQPALFIAASCHRADIGSTLMKLLPEVYQSMDRFGVTAAGPPFCRYISQHGDEIDVEAGLPITRAASSADLRVRAGTLGGCEAAYTVHRGPYSHMGDTYAALER